MSVEKSVVRIGVAREIGAALDDALEGAQSESSHFEGAKAALDQTAAMVQKLALLVDADLDGKGEGEVPDLTTAKLVKKYITRAVAVVQSAAIAAEQKRLMATGKVQAYRAAVTGIAKRVDAEEAALQAVKDTSPDENPARAPGTRPPSSIKQRRLAEEAAGKAPSSPEKASTEPAGPKPIPKPKRARTAKRRGRRPKDGADSG